MIFTEQINEALGSRKRFMTEDQYQIFWVGVLKALKTVDQSRDIIPYLIVRGLGEIKNDKRAENTKKYTKYCPVCGFKYSFRDTVCKCGNELEIDNRIEVYEDSVTHDVDVTDKIMIEQFVSTLEGNRKYIAKRWLIDRADLMCQNWMKQVAFELSISAPAIASQKKKIQKEFLLWYHN